MVQIMEKEVVIKIVDKHEMDGDTDGLETTIIGKFEGGKDSYVLSYTEDGELAGCSVRVKVENGNCVTMTRSGMFETELIIHRGERHNCSYSTPAGNLMLGVFGKRVESDVDENGGKLEFDYTLDLGAGVFSENYLVITVTPA